MTDRTEVLHLKTLTFLLMNSQVRNYFQCKFLAAQKEYCHLPWGLFFPHFDTWLSFSPYIFQVMSSGKLGNNKKKLMILMTYKILCTVNYVNFWCGITFPYKTHVPNETVCQSRLEHPQQDYCATIMHFVFHFMQYMGIFFWLICDWSLLLK